MRPCTQITAHHSVMLLPPCVHRPNGTRSCIPPYLRSFEEYAEISLLSTCLMRRSTRAWSGSGSKKGQSSVVPMMMQGRTGCSVRACGRFPCLETVASISSPAWIRFTWGFTVGYVYSCIIKLLHVYVCDAYV